jgi:asparagine synthase (glutamine-hydrolysing)
VFLLTGHRDLAESYPMCGICGFINPEASCSAEDLLGTARAMCDRIIHRGPDSQGQWADPDFGIALGHRRLSIIDLSPAGNQPMTSPHDRYVISFNGEIYNFKEIAALLEAERKAPVWKGHSDTEVVLAAMEAWGVERALRVFNGMFAFVAWDKQEKRLIAARDRCGKKPLYYGWIGGVFMFGSELKALRAHPRFSADIDPASLAFFLNHSYIPVPHTIFSCVKKLPQGSYFILDRKEITQRGAPAVLAYWDVRETFAAARRNAFSGTREDAVTRLDELLGDAVRLRMIADVPLGAFLSGGVDSSLIVSFMQRESLSPVKTFTIGFPGECSDESAQARAIAGHLRTDHTEIQVTAKDALAVVRRCAKMYDEPYADDSQIPTWLVCKNCRDHVTVALSGDGGDELFAGYESYRSVMRNWPLLAIIPPAFRKIAASVIGSGTAAGNRGGLKNRRVAEKLRCKDFAEYYQWYMSFNKTGQHPLLASSPPCSSAFSRKRSGSILQKMLITDFVTFLTDDVLAKVDRASMNTSLEVRNPLLDYRIIEFAWTLPHRFLTNRNTGKLLLRSLLYRSVPRSLAERPKASFGIPLSQWLRTDLRSWADELLDETRLRRQGILDCGAVRTLWREHTGDTWDHGRLLWNILMFESWHAEWMEGRSCEGA